MSDYKSIHGVRVVGHTADPDNIIEGQIWYDDTASTVQYQIPDTISSWRIGGSMNTARQIVAGAGTQTAGLVFGGNVPNTALNESYDGSSWTELADLNTARRAYGGAGTQTAALLAAGHTDGSGSDTAVVESWNGSKYC